MHLNIMVCLHICCCSDDEKATAELNDLLYSRITERLNAPRIDPNLASL